MRGAPLQTAEEREAAIDFLEDEQRDKDLLKSATEKVQNRWDSLHSSWRYRSDHQIIMKLTIGELRVLRQFIRKHYNE